MTTKKTDHSVHFSSTRHDWATPQGLFDTLNAEFNFTLDPCATDASAKCKKYYTVEDDGLSKSWQDERVFMNPPYGREIGKWVKKAFESKAELVVCLIPARTDTKWFHEYIYNKSEIRFIRGRVHFDDSKNSAPFPSMLVIFKGE